MYHQRGVLVLLLLLRVVFTWLLRCYSYMPIRSGEQIWLFILQLYHICITVHYLDVADYVELW